MRSMATLAVGVVAIPLAGLVEARVGRPATPASVAGLPAGVLVVVFMLVCHWLLFLMAAVPRG
jgi:hypothetical protein